ncbi:metallophosphoesterase family protein [Kibdelosporangium aridum]|uniref:Phosphoesterase, MJ0936 family n=1 Tax=Kibdelosporangium aridum TaxID=2030 RepID=A0A1W2FRN8_KIBAR|nr:metallophosphoesterase family protein [Kibdelosporangium aridum]SMD24601.1 phosphoesterase, MJ0936 family [Kibdelosporangium aridum]
MVSRVAVLSDIHAVMPALAAVLAEPDVQAADKIVLTGDIAAGPQPEAVLDTLLDLGDRVVWLSGNADREIVEFRRGQRDQIPDEIAMWAADRVRDDQLDFLANLPHTRQLPVEGLGEVLFCHGTPRADDEIVLVDTNLDRWAEVLDGVDAKTVVCGNTHMPFVRLAHGTLVVNPGSVGMPYGRPGAHWALLGPGVDLRRTLFDVDAAIADVRTCGYPGIDEWSDFFLRARATAAEAMQAFSGEVS